MVRSVDSNAESELPPPLLPRLSRVGKNLQHTFSKDAGSDAEATAAVTRKSLSGKTQELRERARTVASETARPRQFVMVTTKEGTPTLKLHADKVCGLVQKISDHIFGKTRVSVDAASYTGPENLSDIQAFAGALDSGSVKLALQILKESSQPETLIKALPKTLLDQFKQPLFDLANDTIKKALLQRFPDLQESAPKPAEQGTPAQEMRKKPPLPPLPVLTAEQKMRLGKTPPPLPPPYTLTFTGAHLSRLRAEATTAPLSLKAGALIGDKISASYRAIVGLNLTNPNAADFKKMLATFNPTVYTSERLERMSPKEAYYALVSEASRLENTIIEGLEKLTELGDRWNAKSRHALMEVLADAHYEITEFLGKFETWNRQAPFDIKPLLLSLKNGSAIDEISRKITAQSADAIPSAMLMLIDRECYELDTPAEELRHAWRYHESDLSSKFTRDTDAFSYQHMRNRLAEIEETFAPRVHAKDLSLLEQISLKRYEARRQQILDQPLSAFVNFTESNQKLLKQLERTDASTWMPTHARLLGAVGFTASEEAAIDRITRVLAKQMVIDLYAASKPVDAMNSSALLLWNKLQSNPTLYQAVEKRMREAGNNLLETFQAQYIT